MRKMLIFGLGYTAAHLADRLRAQGWAITATGSAGDLDFDDSENVYRALDQATHILSSVPPDSEMPDSNLDVDPVLKAYGPAIAKAPAEWCAYLSSTGVYGDVGGAWVDENAPIGTGRRKARSEADRRWQELRGDMRVFRLPGIYGPDRSPLDRVRNGKARRIDLPGQIFSRIHVDDIAAAIIASFDRPAGVYNIADDMPAPNAQIIAYAAWLLGMEPPPLLSLEEANLSAAARAFYAENRRVAGGKAKRLLGWEPKFPDYKAGLQSLL